MNTEQIAEEIVAHVRETFRKGEIEGCDDETCRLFLPIKQIIEKRLFGHLKSTDLIDKLEKIPGGYAYSGFASYQLCFPLKAGGELRMMLVDDQNHPMFPGSDFCIDHYGGALPTGITGHASKTGGQGHSFGL